MNIEVQSTDRIQRPQLLSVVEGTLPRAGSESTWCSSLTIAIVRVQGPGQRQHFRFHDIANGTTEP